MRYRYSKDIVYNNFPWPEPTETQKAKIEATAQGILDARALYPESSLADLYDELTMPTELRKATKQMTVPLWKLMECGVRCIPKRNAWRGCSGCIKN